MKKWMVFSSFILVACAPPAPTQPSPQPSAPTKASVQPQPQPTPVNSVAPTVEDKIREILTSRELKLLVNEELMLIGDVSMNSGKKITFDAVLELLKFENKNPDLLSLDPANRLVKALKSGTATVIIASKQQPQIQVPIKVIISAPAPEIDPNVALVDVEIQ